MFRVLRVSCLNVILYGIPVQKVHHDAKVGSSLFLEPIYTRDRDAHDIHPRKKLLHESHSMPLAGVLEVGFLFFKSAGRVHGEKGGKKSLGFQGNSTLCPVFFIPNL